MLGLVLSACQTADEATVLRNAEFDSLVGGTMADFMRRTSLTPSDAYPTNSGRTFVVHGQSTSIVLPGSYGVPTVGRTVQCQMLVDTVATGGLGTAGSWQVTQISRSGNC